jgi:hypothetical protein
MRKGGREGGKERGKTLPCPGMIMRLREYNQSDVRHANEV